jgi:hypothetical protein
MDNPRVSPFDKMIQLSYEQTALADTNVRTPKPRQIAARRAARLGPAGFCMLKLVQKD